MSNRCKTVLSGLAVLWLMSTATAIAVSKHSEHDKYDTIIYICILTICVTGASLTTIIFDWRDQKRVQENISNVGRAITILQTDKQQIDNLETDRLEKALCYITREIAERHAKQRQAQRLADRQAQ